MRSFAVFAAAPLLLPAVVRAQGPARMFGGGTPVRCAVSIDGKKALDLSRPARRPYPLPISGRKLSVSFGMEQGRLSIQIVDAGKLVSHGSWSSASTVARAEATLAKTGALNLVAGDRGSPEIKVACSLLPTKH